MSSPSDALLHTPLHALHVELGAKLVPFAGYEMPVAFPAGILAEHRQCRESAALFDVSHMGQIALRGDGAAAALETLVPADLVGLGSGRQRYGFFTNANGGTRIVPGSHKWDRSPVPGEQAEYETIEMAAGSVVVYHGSLWHGGGENETDARRMGIVVNHCAGFMRQEENQLLAIPREVAREFPRRLQELIGYGVFRGLMGHVEKQDRLRAGDGRDAADRARQHVILGFFGSGGGRLHVTQPNST